MNWWFNLDPILKAVCFFTLVGIVIGIVMGILVTLVTVS